MMSTGFYNRCCPVHWVKNVEGLNANLPKPEEVIIYGQNLLYLDILNETVNQKSLETFLYII